MSTSRVISTVHSVELKVSVVIVGGIHRIEVVYCDGSRRYVKMENWDILLE